MKEGLLDFLQAVLNSLIAQALLFVIVTWAVTGSPLQEFYKVCALFVDAETGTQFFVTMIWVIFTLLLSIAAREQERDPGHMRFDIRM